MAKSHLPGRIILTTSGIRGKSQQPNPQWVEAAKKFYFGQPIVYQGRPGHVVRSHPKYGTTEVRLDGLHGKQTVPAIGLEVP